LSHFSANECPADSVALMLAIHGDVIKTAAMAVVPDHDRGHDLAVNRSDQNIGLRLAPREGDILLGIVPRPRQTATFP
jgi:hypothetical protein